MVKKLVFILLSIVWLGCDPDSNVGEKPSAPVLLDLTASVPFNEKGIRPDPNRTRHSHRVVRWEELRIGLPERREAERLSWTRPGF